MSERHNEYPSAQALGELQALARKPDRASGGRKPPDTLARAWEILLNSFDNSDFAVVLDFALENGLTQPPASEVKSLADGQRTRGPAWVNPIDGSEMVWISPGPFYVGPKKQRAECAGFALARHPITNAQFKRFLDESGYAPPEDHSDNELFLSHWSRGKPSKGKEEHPVVWVSFIDAVYYCRWAGLSLPTEWLWEKAARGPEGRAYPWGDTVPRDNKLANVHGRGTREVGSYPRTRSPHGCEDLIGNVSEWCRMTDGENFGHLPRDLPDAEPPAEGVTIYAAVRGSCFLRTVPNRMVASHRRRLSVTRRNQWVGFRPACFLPCRPAL